MRLKKKRKKKRTKIIGKKNQIKITENRKENVAKNKTKNKTENNMKEKLKYNKKKINHLKYHVLNLTKNNKKTR